MNIQSIICSFILAIGLVLICVSTNTADDDSEFTKNTYTVLQCVGGVMIFVGAVGYIYTIYEVLQRMRLKFRERRLRKLNQQTVRRVTIGKTTEIGLESGKGASMNGGVV